MEFALLQLAYAGLGALSWFLAIRRNQAQISGRRTVVSALVGLETVVGVVPVYVGALQSTFLPILMEALGACIGAWIAMRPKVSS